MHDAATQVLPPGRAQTDGLWPMLAISSIGHVVVIVALVLGGAFHPAADDPPKTVMTISLGGAPGPRAGGMTPMGGRPVQQVQPTPPPRPEPVRPPAAKPPAMTVPMKDARPAPPKREMLRQAPEEATARTPTPGPREQLGSAMAETGGQGIGLGLSTGGGGTGGEINVGDFCCPEYLSTMLQLIQRNWNEKQAVGGQVVVRFTIRRDGSIIDVQTARTSGYAALDLNAQRAVGLTRLPPLPPAYTNPSLTINLTFQYQR